MTEEIELKMRVRDVDEKRLLSGSLFKQYAQDNPKLFSVQTHYYDTPDFKLRQQNMALRLRISEGWIWQTFKRSLAHPSGLHQREEFENKVKTLDFEWEQFPDSARQALQGIDYQQLQCLFTTSFERHRVNLLCKGKSEIEFVLDQGKVTAGEYQWPLSEIEFELKRGEKKQLIDCALALQSEVSLAWEPVSKAAKGYALVGYNRQHATIPESLFDKLQQCWARVSLAPDSQVIADLSQCWQQYLSYLKQQKLLVTFVEPASSIIPNEKNIETFLFMPEVNRLLLMAIREALLD